MNQKLWEQFLDYKSLNVISCKTEDEAKQLFEICIENEIRTWNTGKQLDFLDNCWNEYKENTCYLYSEDKMSYGSVEYFSKRKFNIIPYKDLMS